MANIKSQLRNAVVLLCRFGADKHAAKKPTDTGKLALDNNNPYIYSFEYRDELLALSSQAATLLKTTIPILRCCGALC
jgi:hypothetical protein